jgi:hypothetical protein
MIPIAFLYVRCSGDASFIINRATSENNSALASAGVEFHLANGVLLLGKFDGVLPHSQNEGLWNMGRAVWKEDRANPLAICPL